MFAFTGTDWPIAPPTEPPVGIDWELPLAPFTSVDIMVLTLAKPWAIIAAPVKNPTGPAIAKALFAPT